MTLPIHGFVLAGGKSTRMGRDKATLEFRGRPLVEIAVEKLRGFCAEVSIAGNRDDLAAYAPVVREERVDCGPAAGVEAGLKASTQPWAMFVPVDVPLVPGGLLRRWAEVAIAEVPEFEATAGSLIGCSLYTMFGNEPAFVLLRPEAVVVVGAELKRGERRLDVILGTVKSKYGDARYLRVDAAWYSSGAAEEEVKIWFSNLNTGEELAAVEGKTR